MRVKKVGLKYHRAGIGYNILTTGSDKLIGAASKKNIGTFRQRYCELDYTPSIRYIVFHPDSEKSLKNRSLAGALGCGSGSCAFLTLDLGWKIWTRNKHPGSAKLVPDGTFP